MISFEEAGAILDEVCDGLPEALFAGLNGGISLLPEALQEPDGRYTMGLYHDDVMGCRIEIFYGSVLAVCGEEDDEAVREELAETLRHELRHHIEGLAGDRSLEIEDERETEEYRRDMELARFEPRRKTGGIFDRLRRRRGGK